MSRRTPAERLALLAAMAEEEDNDLLPRDFGRLVTTEHELDELLDQYEADKRQRQRRRAA
jgi:hypothetical protein